jgi:hypothetical protein
MQASKMKKTWTSLTAGILDIVAGLLGMFCLIVTLRFFGFFYLLPMCIAEPDFPMCVMIFPLITLAVFIFAVSILAIVGGVYALRRKMRGLALAGSIAAFFASWPLGIAAIIFTALSKNEFE